MKCALCVVLLLIIHCNGMVFGREFPSELKPWSTVAAARASFEKRGLKPRDIAVGEDGASAMIKVDGVVWRGLEGTLTLFVDDLTNGTVASESFTTECTSSCEQSFDAAIAAVEAGWGVPAETGQDFARWQKGTGTPVTITVNTDQESIFILVSYDDAIQHLETTVATWPLIPSATADKDSVIYYLKRQCTKLAESDEQSVSALGCPCYDGPKAKQTKVNLDANGFAYSIEMTFSAADRTAVLSLLEARFGASSQTEDGMKQWLWRGGAMVMVFPGDGEMVVMFDMIALERAAFR
ncbi:MAG: hypothetical protein MUC47_02360 [Candidatus Kapabacteria bacterium]|jgi:hypothetical protein|nr:hypothetical protein [Candidatus Kapabacteria bacterium]